MKVSPRKAAQKSTPGAKPVRKLPVPAEQSVMRRQDLLIRMGVLLPLVLLVITLTRGANVKKSLPDYLLGTWQTSAVEYKDCYMEISPARIVFGNVENGYTLYFVSHFEQIMEGGQSLTVIHYTDLDGKAYEMSLVYNRFPRETIQFKHKRTVVWERRPEA